MADLQEQFDDAMFDFSQGRADEAIAKLKNILSANPDFFDAQLALGGAYYAKGDYAAAIDEGHKAEKMRPNDQLVHTNLSRAYMKAGDKPTAEHHALQSRIASWRGDMSAPTAKTDAEKELEIAKPPAPPVKPPPTKFPDMPWKKNKPVN
jgi:tetratricopeptide (TPR) repeat protein